MLMRTVLALLLATSALAATSCAAPPSSEGQAATGLAPGAILAIVRRRAEPYPEVVLSDYTVNPDHTSACAYLRIPNKPPHVVSAFIDKDRVRIAGPFLHEPGDWDRPENRGLSEHRADLCALFGSPLPAA
jgi:hypothetical protein